jgi:hypothetical protein
MATTPRLTDLRDPAPSPIPAGAGGWKSAFRRLRFDRTLGFWLGGAVLGTAGCIAGASMPYRHPVAVTANLLWWGIFLGCLGGSIGALLGLWAEQTPGDGKPDLRACTRPQARAGEHGRSR